MNPFENSLQLDNLLNTYIDRGPFADKKAESNKVIIQGVGKDDPKSIVGNSVVNYGIKKPTSKPKVPDYVQAFRWQHEGRPKIKVANDNLRRFRQKGLAPYVNLEILVRTSPLTPWRVEKFLAETAGMCITVGIHKQNDRRRPATPRWSFSHVSAARMEAETVEYNLDDMSLDDLIASCKEEAARTPYNLIPNGADEYWQIYNPQLTRASVSNAHLGATREFGDWQKNIPPRPWLEPAIEKNKGLITELWALALKRTFRYAMDVNTMGNWIVIGGSSDRIVGSRNGKGIFMGSTNLQSFAPSGGPSTLNFRREMMQAFRPFLAALENLAKDSLLESDADPLHQFTIDYKEYGGQFEYGGRIIPAGSSSRPGVFTGQLRDAIHARFEGSYNYPVTPVESL